MNKWLKFFLGTPRRAVVTASILASIGICHIVSPGTISFFLHGIIKELNPVISAIIYLGLIYLGFRIMIKPLMGGSKKNKR